MVFMDTAATIPTGALAERWRFVAFAVFSVFVGAVIYPIYATWTWGGGWLAMLGKNLGLGHGHVDFAGSSVVHMTGGVMAFVTAILLGPRRGKYGADGSVRAIAGHNIPMALVGTFILAFGWFGFNAGSTLAGSDLRIGVIATNTMLAGAAGGVTAMLYVWLKYGKPDPSMLANGTLAGLVAITAPCAFVTAPSAVLISVVAVSFKKNRQRYIKPWRQNKHTRGGHYGGRGGRLSGLSGGGLEARPGTGGPGARAGIRGSEKGGGGGAAVQGHRFR